jgi:DNA-binding MarR family transcriptional regulator
LISRYYYQIKHLDVKRYAVVMGSLTDEEHADERAAADARPRDEVDDLITAWRSQRPDLDVEPLQVLSRVSRLARHLDIARRGAFAAHGLESWEFDVLSALRRAGPPFQLTPGALLRATLVTSGTMTNRIDRLTDSGLVYREPDPRDRRGVLVTLSDRGRDVVDSAFTDLLDREQALLARLGPTERQDLSALLRTLLIPFDEGGASGAKLPGSRRRVGLACPRHRLLDYSSEPCLSSEQRLPSKPGEAERGRDRRARVLPLAW